MDILFEIIICVIFEGIYAGANSKKVPMPLRILLAIVIVVPLFAIIVLLLWAAVEYKSILFGAVDAVVLLGFAAMVTKLIKSLKQR